jgi:hypothetical membrane protein
MKKQRFRIQNGLLKISGLCGILTPLVVFTCIGVAMSQSPWFSWSNHALSDLGVEMVSAPFFNYGVIFGGLLIFIFSLGLMKLISCKIGAYFLCLSSVGLIGIGVFPETVQPAHFIVASIFFVFLIISLLIIGLTVKQTNFEHSMSILAFSFAILALLSTLFLIPFKGVAITESLACYPAFVWCMIYGLRMLVL